MIQVEVVEYQDENQSVTLTVSEATVLIGLKRTRLKLEQDKIEEPDPDRRLLRVITYPDLMAATVEADGFKAWPVTFDEFIELPEPLAIHWEEAVYRLNPHWLPPRTQEKKASPTTSTDD